VILDLDDEPLVASDYAPIRSAIVAAAEIREELACCAIWEIRIDCDGAVVIDMLLDADVHAASDHLGLATRFETRREFGYHGAWRGAVVRVIGAKPGRILRAWSRVTGRLR
jgi:hypothetical protein